MSVEQGVSFEQSPQPSPDTAVEQSRIIALTSVIQQAGEDHSAFLNMDPAESKHFNEDPTKGPDRTRIHLALLSQLPDKQPLKNPFNLIGRDKEGKENGKNMHIAVADNSGTVVAIGEKTDVSNNMKKHTLSAITQREGNVVTVTTTKGEILRLPLSVVQEAHLITHADAHLKGNIDESQRKIIEAYVATASGDTSKPGADKLSSADLKEAGEKTPAIQAEAVTAYIDQIVSKSESEQSTPELDAKVAQLEELKEKLSKQQLCLAEDVTNVIKIMASEEFTSISIQEITSEIDKIKLELQDNEQQLKDSPEKDDYRKVLLKIRSKKKKELKELTLKKQLYSELDENKNVTAIQTFFEDVQNGKVDKVTINGVNEALKSGDMEKIYEQIVGQLDKGGLSDEEKAERIAKINEYKKKGLMIGAGLLLAFILMMMKELKDA